jgi:hypothetical protein
MFYLMNILFIYPLLVSIYASLKGVYDSLCFETGYDAISLY